MRGHFTFYMQNAYAISRCLPACDTDVVGSFACALVGCNPTREQLRRFFGARRSLVQAIHEYLLDSTNRLVGVHELAREAHVSEENLLGYEEDGSVPQEIMNALFPVADRNNAVANARSTHAHGNSDPETSTTTTSENNDARFDVPAEEWKSEESKDAIRPAPFIIETSAVMPTGDDMAKSDTCRPARLRSLRSMLNDSARGSTTSTSLAHRANAEAAVTAGRAPPVLPSNALVVTHTGNMLSDFYDKRVFPGAYPDLFPHAVGGHLDERRRAVSFKEWSQICLRQRDARLGRAGPSCSACARCCFAERQSRTPAGI